MITYNVAMIDVIISYPSDYQGTIDKNAAEKVTNKIAEGYELISATSYHSGMVAGIQYLLRKGIVS